LNTNFIDYNCTVNSKGNRTRGNSLKLDKSHCQTQNCTSFLCIVLLEQFNPEDCRSSQLMVSTDIWIFCIVKINGFLYGLLVGIILLAADFDD